MNKAEIQTSFVDEFELKGFSEPEKVYKVDQKYRTRVITDQYIVFTDAKGFNQYLNSREPEQVESFLLECDDLINYICEEHNGVIRQVNGDEYFLTFSEPLQTFSAIKEICENWRHIIGKYGLGISLGVHRGNLNVIRSFVYGDDIHTTVALSGFDKFYGARVNEIWVVASRKIIGDLKELLREGQCQELDSRLLTQERFKSISQQHGAYRLLFD